MSIASEQFPLDYRVENAIEMAKKELTALGRYVDLGDQINPVALIDDLLYARYLYDSANHDKFRYSFAARTGLVFRGRHIEVLDTQHSDVCLDTQTCVPVPSPIFPDHYVYLCFSVSEQEAQQALQIHRGLSAAPVLLPRPKIRYRVIRAPWIEDLAARCSLFGDFLGNKGRLTFGQLTGLVLALGGIKGFEAQFMAAMNHDLYSEAEQQRWRYDFDKLRQRAVKKHPPTCADMGCPYRVSFACPSVSLTAFLPRRRGEIRSIESVKPGIPLTESRNNLRDVWQDVYQAQDTNIHLILVDCGVGKTHVLLEQPLEKMFVAAPTHQLKGEHLKRYPYNGHLVWPEIPELPNPFSEAMQQRHASGIGRTSHIIQECINNGHHIDANIQAACLNYLQAEEAIETAPLVFCTHEKALTAVNDVIDTIVFDEDPLSTIMRSTTIRADDMEPMIDFLEHQGDADLHEMAGYARWVMTLEKGIFRRRRYFFCGDILRVIAHNDFPRLSSPAYALFLCQVVEKQQDGNLVCTQVRPLPSEKKVIILSASANVPFYQALNKDRVIVYDLRGTELKGQIIQHPEHSYSKASLQGISEDELARRIQADTERYGLEGVIVYKQLKEIHDAGAFLRGSQVPVICNYGAQYGLDAFKGRTIGIYGVPHLTDGAYKTMALAIGLPINDYMRYQPIHHNGFEFEMWTYKNEKLRALQLAAIDAEYIQAIGRARLVDHDATVHVFSNYPVPGAVITKDD